MDASERIKRFEEFFNQPYKQNILKSAGKGNRFVIIDFKELLAFDPKIAEDLLENPEDVIKASETAVEAIELPSDIKNFRVRFKNIPETQRVMINEIRSSHIGKLLTIAGIVRQKTDVRPQVTTSKFECPNCGNVISVLQIERKFREPSRCSCGWKGNFKLLNEQHSLQTQSSEILPMGLLLVAVVLWHNVLFFEHKQQKGMLLE